VQHVNLPVIVARHQHLVLRQPRAHEIAMLLELALVRHIDPEPAEDALELELEDRRVRIGAPVDMVGPHQAANVVHRGAGVSCVTAWSALAAMICLSMQDTLNNSGNTDSASKPAPGASDKVADPSSIESSAVSRPNGVVSSIATSARPSPRPATQCAASR